MTASNPAATDRIGSVIGGKYRVDSVLGQGGMATVYGVVHVRNAARLAIKVLHPSVAMDRDVRTRFLREGYAANSVGHPGAVMVVDDAETDDGSVFIVMERLEGQSLDALEGRVRVDEAVAIGDGLLDVLAAAHARGILHRDIKPANVFVTRTGVVKVLDFGIARVRDAYTSGSGATTDTSVVFGTPAFMSPEQARGETIDARSDLWAVGATLYTLVSGRLVHEAPTPVAILLKTASVAAPPLASVAPHVPRSLAQVVDRALSLSARERYASAADMQRALREAFREAFGGAPTAELLRSAARPMLHVVASHAPATDATTRPRERAPALQPQTQLVSSTVPQPGASRLRLPFALGMASIVVAGAFVFLASTKVRMSPATPGEPPRASASVGASAPMPSSATAAPAATAAPTGAGSQSSQLGTPTMAVSALPLHGSPAPKKRRCDPGYVVDDAGHHVYLPECLE